jgi:hypothetical protein
MALSDRVGGGVFGSNMMSIFSHDRIATTLHRDSRTTVGLANYFISP